MRNLFRVQRELLEHAWCVYAHAKTVKFYINVGIDSLITNDVWKIISKQETFCTREKQEKRMKIMRTESN